MPASVGRVPLAIEDVTRALSEATGKDAAEPDETGVRSSGEGSVGRAIALLDGSVLALRQRVLELFAQLPDPRSLHALGEALAAPTRNR